MYRVRTKIGQQRLEREHVMTFVGGSNLEGDARNQYLNFNARPKAGTQVLHWEDIISIEPVRDNSKTHDSPDHYMNKVVKPKRKK
jgi:hypothetical protein